MRCTHDKHARQAERVEIEFAWREERDRRAEDETRPGGPALEPFVPGVLFLRGEGAARAGRGRCG